MFIAVFFKALRSGGTSSFIFDILTLKLFYVEEPLLFINDFSFDVCTYFGQNSSGASADLQSWLFISVLASCVGETKSARPLRSVLGFQ